MSGRRRGNAGKGFSSFLSIIVFGLIVVAFSQIYPRFQRNKQYTGALNNVRNDFSSQQWASAIDGYKKLWKDYPDKERADVFNLAAAHENWATELYESSLNTRQKWDEASKQFELAAELRPLGEDSMMALGDCYLEQNLAEKCKILLREAGERADLDSKKFDILRKRLAQLQEGGNKKKK